MPDISMDKENEVHDHEEEIAKLYRDLEFAPKYEERTEIYKKVWIESEHYARKIAHEVASFVGAYKLKEINMEREDLEQEAILELWRLITGEKIVKGERKIFNPDKYEGKAVFWSFIHKDIRGVLLDLVNYHDAPKDLKVYIRKYYAKKKELEYSQVNTRVSFDDVCDTLGLVSNVKARLCTYFGIRKRIPMEIKTDEGDWIQKEGTDIFSGKATEDFEDTYLETDDVSEEYDIIQVEDEKISYTDKDERKKEVLMNTELSDLLKIEAEQMELFDDPSMLEAWRIWRNIFLRKIDNGIEPEMLFEDKIKFLTPLIDVEVDDSGEVDKEYVEIAYEDLEGQLRELLKSVS